MADVLEPEFRRSPGLGRSVGVLPLQGLHTGFLVKKNGVDARSQVVRRITVQGTDPGDRFTERLLVVDHRVLPVLDLLRTQIGLFEDS